MMSIDNIRFNTLSFSLNKQFFDPQAILANQYTKVASCENQAYYKVEGYQLSIIERVVKCAIAIFQSFYSSTDDVASLWREVKSGQKEIVLCGTDLPDAFSKVDLENYVKKLFFFICEFKKLLKTALCLYPNLKAAYCFVKDIKIYDSNNVLTELPESIGNFQSLQYLNLMCNRLIALPDSIGHLQSLQELNISMNLLRELPNSVGHLQSLQTLDLWSNSLRKLPKNIGNLQNLQRLNLNFNQLGKLPDSIGHLQSLQQLNLKANELRELPDTIGNLQNLQTLDLDSNQLRELPNSVGHLQSLQQLNLSGNQFTTIPPCLLNLPSSCEVNLEGNPLTQEAIDQLQHLQTGPRFIISASGLEDKAVFKPLDKILEELYGKDFPQGLLDWQEENRNNLAVWLLKLQETKDYITDRKAVIDKLKPLLDWLAIEDSPQAFVILKLAGETCKDRAALAFNDLYLLMQISSITKISPINFTAIAQLIIGMKKVEIIRIIAEEKIKSLQMTDPIEVHLFYQTNLKEVLDLPLVVNDLAYASLVSVTKQDLKNAETRVLKETSAPIPILLESDAWKQCLQQHPDFKDIEQKCNTLKNQAIENFDTTDTQALVAYQETFKLKDATDWNPYYLLTMQLCKNIF